MGHVFGTFYRRIYSFFLYRFQALFPTVFEHFTTGWFLPVPQYNILWILCGMAYYTVSTSTYLIYCGYYLFYYGVIYMLGNGFGIIF